MERQRPTAPPGPTGWLGDRLFLPLTVLGVVAVGGMAVGLVVPEIKEEYSEARLRAIVSGSKARRRERRSQPFYEASGQAVETLSFARRSTTLIRQMSRLRNMERARESLAGSMLRSFSSMNQALRSKATRFTTTLESRVRTRQLHWGLRSLETLWRLLMTLLRPTAQGPSGKDLARLEELIGLPRPPATAREREVAILRILEKIEEQSWQSLLVAERLEILAWGTNR